MFNDTKDMTILCRLLCRCCSQHVAPGSLVRMNISLR